MGAKGCKTCGGHSDAGEQARKRSARQGRAGFGKAAPGRPKAFSA
jgi:hypothetical protein